MITMLTFPSKIIITGLIMVNIIIKLIISVYIVYL